MGAFGFEVRVLVCPQCAAPLEVAAAGGPTTCRYCGQTSVFSPRPPPTPVGDHQGAVRDPARLERLRAQHETPDLPPPDLMPLLQSRLAGDGVQQAQRLLADQRVTPPSPTRDVRLHWLTVGLFNAFAGPEHGLRQRALIQSALELMGDPRRRAVLTGMLARNAVRAGELEAAWSWVSHMDPASESLVADSAYRLSRAYLSTARHAFDDVLFVLGRGLHDVPIDAGDALMCGMMRANALERGGLVDEATAQLRAFVEHDPALADLMRQVVTANPSLHLCAQSLAKLRSGSTA